MRTTLSALAASVVAAPTTAVLAQSDGCGKSHIFNGITKYFDVESSGRSRDYSVHLPEDYDENVSHPVVFGFHGTESVGFFFEADTKMSEKRFSGDKIMVYPTGVDGAWAGANYSTLSVEEDLQFVTDLLTEIRSEYCVDDSRIYATGISNGGGFVNAIACSPTVGAEFAAFAPSSGSYYRGVGGTEKGECNPSRTPLPIIEFHGGSDESVFYDGGSGSGGILPSIPDWLDSWAERNGCEESMTEDSFDGDVHHTSWTNCGGNGTSSNAILQHWKVDDMGHCWPSTEINFSQISVGEGPTHIQASQLIMEFFDQFTKP